MKLISIDLENIRSYRHEKVEFRDGISLFEGDIGSGKSSILNAIEFALFGLGDLSGSHILRVGENEAKVELELEINEHQYVFGRTLKRRGSSVNQDSCYIIDDDVKTDYSVTDMKKRVLQLLDFKEPSNPRSHSVIYRFAIFTPQEAMKEVLGQKPSDRKQTLRKAFGIEEYNTASENTAHLVSDINVDLRVLEKSAAEIESIITNIEVEEAQITNLDEQNTETGGQIKELEAEKEEKQGLLETKKKEVTEYNDLNKNLGIAENTKDHQKGALDQEKQRQQEIAAHLNKSLEAEKTIIKLTPDYEKLVSSKERRRELEPKKSEYDNALKNSEIETQKIETEKKSLQRQIHENKDEITEFETKIKAAEEEIEKLPEKQNKAQDIEKKLKDLQKLREESNTLTAQISEKKQAIKTLEEYKDRLANEWKEIESIGLGAQCPRCQQELSAEHYDLLRKKYEKEIKEAEEEAKKIKSKKGELDSIQEQVIQQIGALTVLEDQLKQLRTDIQALDITKGTLEENREKLSKLTTKNEEIQNQLNSDNYALESRANLDKNKNTIQNLTDDVNEFNSLKTIIDDFEKSDFERKYHENKALADQKSDYEKQLEGSKKEIEKIEKNLDESKKNITDLNKKLEKFDSPDKERDQLQDQLTDTVEKIAGFTSLISTNKERIEEARNRIATHRENLGRHQRNLEQSEEYKLIRSWLEEAFIPSIHNVEQNVLRKLHTEFNRLFVKWFKTLLESEDIEGYIDEDFTPIIDQSGYELEIASLSGGEKTSVALAYRLALNTIVKQVTDTMKNNLLILDEPTDGFSREQLFRMRDILHDLNCEQVIMVSHEKELESVADYVYQVNKEGTISSVIHP